MNFCPECGTRLSEDEYTDDEGYDESNTDSVGIIFTDSGALAHKYGVSVDDVKEILSCVIHSTDQFNQDWHILDIYDHKDELGDGTWMDYSDVL